jgi:membrane-associated phospholipid phosphatase
MQAQAVAADVISLSALFVPVAGAVWTGSWALLIGLIGANAAVAGLKRLIGGSGVWGRPVGAHGCGALCDGGAVSGEPGFPSGHMTSVAMFATVMWSWSSIDWRIMAAWVLAVAWSRWVKRCHSVLQILGGAAFGVGCGVLFVCFLGPK